MHLKPIVNFTISKRFYSGMKNFLGLVGTLEHNILLEDGSRYKDCLHSFIDLGDVARKIQSSPQTPQDCMPHTLFKIMAISNIGENLHIHSALEILKALNLSIHTPHKYSPYHYSGHYRCSRPFLMEADSLTIQKSRTHQWRDHLNSGKIYRKQREIRLMNFQRKVNHRELPQFDPDMDHMGSSSWNVGLISFFLIPILDQCPKSDEVRALLIRRMRQVSLDYTLRRRFQDAAYRYLRRTSGAGNI